jgi:UDP-N-acetyl-alpha-D-muramoyl-L-alanyl-L-glutamate epimerase
MQENLREKYPEFTYESFTYSPVKNGLEIGFTFKLGNEIEFHPTLKINQISEQELQRVPHDVLDRLVFNLGMVEMLSYWKAAASPKIIIKPLGLNTIQKAWWYDLLVKGMGEFFYKNKIDFRGDDFVRITGRPFDFGTHQMVHPFAQGDKESVGRSPDYGTHQTVHPFVRDDKINSALVPVGGGKDSAVTLEVMKKFGMKYTAFALNPIPATLEMVKLNNCDLITAEREIDPTLIRLNHEGFYNGHTPFSAYLAFLSLIVAVLKDDNMIVLSNEQSSNQPTAKYLDTAINHQYSKTYEFEQKFREYVNQYLVADISYFSLLRPLGEIQISKIFAKFPEYFPIFISCNRGGKENRWCGECAKCLSTFILLAPFIELGKLELIFKKNLFTDINLAPILDALVKNDLDRPFECVGTREEIITAIYLIIQKSTTPFAPLLTYARDDLLVNKFNMNENEVNKLLGEFHQNNFVLEELGEILELFIS